MNERNAIKLIAQIQRSSKNIAFNELCKLCTYYFGEPRQKGTSHRIYRTPWPGDPRINIQNDNGKAKVYQVKQVLSAIRKLEKMK